MSTFCYWVLPFHVRRCYNKNGTNSRAYRAVDSWSWMSKYLEKRALQIRESRPNRAWRRSNGTDSHFKRRRIGSQNLHKGLSFPPILSPHKRLSGEAFGTNLQQRPWNSSNREEDGTEAHGRKYPCLWRFGEWSERGEWMRVCPPCRRRIFPCWRSVFSSLPLMCTPYGSQPMTPSNRRFVGFL